MYKDKPNVYAYYVDSGAAFPHVRLYIQDTCKLFGVPLRIVNPPESVLTYIARKGFPADIIPNDALPEVQHLFKKPNRMLQPYLRCCSNTLFAPMLKAMKRDKIDTIVRGSKLCDYRVAQEQSIDGIPIVHPLWNWTDQEVFNYIRDHDIQLPIQYLEGYNTSLDCWICSGHLPYEGKARLEFTKKHYPSFYKVVRDHIEQVQSIVKHHQDKVNGAL